MKHCPENRHGRYHLLSDASPRAVFLGHTDLDSFRTLVTVFGSREEGSSRCSSILSAVVEFSWALTIQTPCIFTMPQQPISSQSSSENTPDLSYVAQPDTQPPQLEAGNSSELDEKDGGSGTNTPSALLPPKDETTGETAHPGPGSEFVVWWNEPADQDPENPMNWSSRRKWFNIITISVISFLV